MKRCDNRGQMKLSFGMIFSIMLIIIFITFSFFAIKKFIDIGDTAQIAKFSSTLQNDIDKAWKGSQSSQEREYYLPSKIKLLCFANFSENSGGQYAIGQYNELYNELRFNFYGSENFFFYPIGSAQGLNSKEIKHIDLIKTTEDGALNPSCIENIDGKIKIIIEKTYGDALVTIKKSNG